MTADHAAWRLAEGHMHAAVQKVNGDCICYCRHMRIWTYVISTDAGSAPNYEPPYVTLSICKPRIRRKAVIGDLVLAFNGSSLHPKPHSVRWAGVVREVMPLGAYWSDHRFRTKRPDKSTLADNIYRVVRGKLAQVKNPIHTAWNAATDIRGVNALIFEKIWYFGDAAPDLPAELGLRMDHGRRHEPCHEVEAKRHGALVSWLDGTQAAIGKIEPPTGEAGPCGSCGPLKPKQSRC